MSRHQNPLRTTTHHQHELPPIRTLTTTNNTTTSPQTHQTHSNQSINLANDPLSQDYKEVEAHLANSLPDFLVSV